VYPEYNNNKLKNLRRRGIKEWRKGGREEGKAYLLCIIPILVYVL
jgi:hypothetical protein